MGKIKTSMTKKAVIILKLGGSLVVPKEIDVGYLRRFMAIVRKHIRKGKRFVIIVGGGYTNRWYRDRAMDAGVRGTNDLHWIGTISTRLNAELVRTVFGALAHPRPYWNFNERISWQRPVLVVGGHLPGHSTDFDAVQMARTFGARIIISLTNVPFLYTKDPQKHRDAAPIREITWREYRRMFGNPHRHLPGQHIPIDAIASRASERDRLETFYVGGKDLANLDRLLSGGKWRGTRIY